MMRRLVNWLLPGKSPDSDGPVVPIYWLKNGFYAKPEDIFSHPNALKQLELLEKIIERQEASGERASFK